MAENTTQSNDKIISKNSNFEEDILKNFEFCKCLNTYYYIQGSKRQVVEFKELKQTVKNDISSKIKQVTTPKEKNILNEFKKSNELSLLITKIKNIDISDLELKENLIITKDGCYNLKTKQLSNIEISEYQTKCSINTNEDAPKWIKFIDDITNGDKKYAEYLQKVAGYWLHGNNNHQCAFFLIGTGANGKTVFIETIKKVLGSFATVVDKSIILKDNKKAKDEYLKLIGKKIAIINELDDTADIKVDVFKRLTGQDSLNIHYKNTNFEYVNRAKLVINTNSIPNLGASTNATWRRIKLLPFNNVFMGDNRDIFLLEELEKELNGIFKWMLEGYDKWVISKSLDEPESIKEITEEYRIMSDPLGGFYHKCKFGDNLCSRVFDLYNYYKAFCEENQIQMVSKERFSQILKAKGFDRTRDNQGMRCFKGIAYDRSIWWYNE